MGIKFNVQGDPTHNTVIGSLATIFSRIVVCAYAGYLLLNMFSFNSTNFSQEFLSNYYVQSDVYYPVNNMTGEIGFNVAFGMLHGDFAPIANMS